MVHLKPEMSEQDKRDYCLSHLRNLIKDIKSVSSEENENREIVINRWENEKYQRPLSIDVTHELKILLSIGGGEDGFKLTFDNQNELLRGVYYCADWGQYVEVQLNEDELNLIYEFYLYGDCSNFLSNK